ncbi:MAG: sigma-70 family RNA polymerase sigma factor [Phycisphaerae bacterium]
MKTPRCPEIQQLLHELILSPAKLRLRQMQGVLRAIELIDPKLDYPYTFVCYQITGYRPRRTPDEVPLDGRALIEDLIDLAEALSRSSPIPTSAMHDRIYGVEALAQRFKVSAKTICRWRRRGLLGWWYRDEDAPPRLAFSERAVQSFVARHLDLVRRGASFKLMRGCEKTRIVTRARELVATEGCSLHAVTLRLAEETGRAVETIRYTLRRFDQEHPGEALFDRLEEARALDEDEVIYEAFAKGETPDELAGRFNKPRSEIEHIVAAVRVRHLAAQPIDYIYNDAFDAPEAERDITGPSPEADGTDGDTTATLAGVPTELPAYLRELYRTPLLSAEQERHLFRKMNYLLHRAEVLRRAIAADPESATVADADAVDAELDAAREIKDHLIQANLRLVVSIAKRHLRGRPATNLFELVSDGNLALIRAIDKFDYGRGFRFSTYASWAIMRCFARSVPEADTQATRFQTGQDEVLASTRDHRATAVPVESPQVRLRSSLTESLAGLDARERLIVERHFGLAEADRARTLGEIGREIGISKERVRQIEQRALGKLRAALGDRGVELLAG